MYDRKTLIGCLLAAGLAAGLAAPAAAALQKCVDDKGKTHYYDRVAPPECVGKPTTQMTNKGVVIKKTEGALSPEQQKAKEEEVLQSKAEAQKLKDQQRRDKALLNTYTSEKEIDLAMNRNLEPIDVAIKSIEPRLKNAEDKLAKTKDADAEREVQRLKSEIAQKQQDKARIKARFESDKERYRELTQKK
ncbi:MAG: DUF4124 domain-containing protein [Betaproteobacteria bacterium]|nr:DUF4124 domain-containing protein [Betaproteobacteria bacterium]